MVGRIPILDVTPQVEGGAYPAKAAVGEAFEVTALVIREGHDALNAEVVLIEPEGRRRAPRRMRRTPGNVDRWRATVTPDTEGAWQFEVHGWGDPVASWHHHAEVKVPAGIDVELVFTEGALLMEQVAKTLDDAGERQQVLDTVKAMRDTSRPVEARLAAALAPEVGAVLDAHPIRELLTASGPFPVFA